MTTAHAVADSFGLEEHCRICLVDQGEWQREAPRFRDYNYWNFYTFAQSYASQKRSVCEFVLVRQGGEIIGAAVVRILMLWPARNLLAYIQWGPLCRRDGASYEQKLRAALQALIDHYVHERRMLLRVDPPYQPVAELAAQGRILEGFGMKRIRGAYSARTVLKQIDLDDDALMKSLERKWRSHLKKSLSADLSLESGTGAEMFDRFELLYWELRQRKAFSSNMLPSTFRAVQPTLTDNDKFLLTLALRNGEAVAGRVDSLGGDVAVSLLGATNSEALKCNAGHWLLWRAMRVARDRGCRWFDLGGINRELNPGGYVFKTGTNGDEIGACGPVEIAHGLRARVTSAGMIWLREGLNRIKRR